MSKEHPETGWEHLVFPAFYGIASLRVLASPSCLFHPRQLPPLPLVCLRCLQPCLISDFPTSLLSPACSLLQDPAVPGSDEASPRPAFTQSFCRETPARRLRALLPKADLLPGSETRWQNKISSFPRLLPALAAAGFGVGTRDHGSISPLPEQTTLLSKLVVSPFLSPRQAPLTDMYK